MRAADLLEGVEGRLLKGALNVDISCVTDDSRRCRPGACFFAIKGERYDGHNFAKDAVDKGAILVVCERELDLDASVFVVRDSRRAAVKVLRNFYGDVDKAFFKVGITGTNGKSTVAFLISQLLDVLKEPNVLLSTVFYKLPCKTFKAVNTTPGLFELWDVMASSVREGAKYLVMEVSSHALKQGRVGDVVYQVAVFTNLSRDHLDYHGTVEDYFSSKLRLFTEHLHGVAVVNADDPYGAKILSAIRGRDVITYGLEKGLVRGRVLDETLEGMEVEVEGMRSKTRLIGKHNLYNILAAFAVAKVLGRGREFMDALPLLKAPPGRLERFCTNGVSVFVDYAHTPDALERVLVELKRLTKGRLIVVFGCGGDRDRGKRPLMGKIASSLADFSVITSDNPRSEDPKAIIEDILTGIDGENYEVILDRRKAIEKAIRMASSGDVVLIAGKGHEDYQIVGDRKLFFDDRLVVREVLEGAVE